MAYKLLLLVVVTWLQLFLIFMIFPFPSLNPQIHHPFILKGKLIQIQYNTVQLLRNLFEVAKIVTKIVKIEEGKFSYFLNKLMNFHGIFRKKVNIIWHATKKTGLHPFSGKSILEKIMMRGVQIDAPTFLGLNNKFFGDSLF